MESELKKKFDVLLKLQEIELESAAVQSELERLPGEMVALDHKAAKSQEIVSQAAARLSELQQAYRLQDSDAKLVQTRISKSQDKLRSVKTNKEYQSSLKEIEDLTVSLSAIEDRMIECLEDIDATESKIKEKKHELQRIVQDIETEKNKIQQSADAMRKKIAGLVEARGRIISETDPTLLNTYETVKKNIGTHAIAIVKDAVCLGCHVNLPPQMFNELLRFDKVFYCPHCERLIYPQSD